MGQLDDLWLDDQYNQDFTTLQDDFNFVLSVERLYTFLRCFNMCDIITKRPDELRVSI